MNPLVSIIIPTYNRAHLIAETLDSVLVQTYTNWECIVVDDGSTDNTEDLLKEYIDKDKRFNYYQRADNNLKGPSSCRNIGISVSNGNFIIFLDSDDLLIDTCLSSRIKFAEENLNFSFWVFKMNSFQNGNLINSKLFNILPSNTCENENQFYKNLFLKGKHPFTITSPLWRRETIFNLKGFDEKLTSFEDPDLHLRAYFEGYNSKTDLFGKTDSFYRQYQNKVRDKYALMRTVNSMIIFNDKYIYITPNELKSNSIKFFKKYILTAESYSVMVKAYFIYLKKNYFNIKQVCLVPIYIFFIFLGFSDKKGMNKILKFITK